MGQVTSRVSDELETALNRWASEENVQRSDLIRQILSESAEARREGRAAFTRPDAPEPADLTRLVTKLTRPQGSIAYFGTMPSGTPNSRAKPTPILARSARRATPSLPM